MFAASRRNPLIVGVIWLALASAASAQTTDGDPENAKVHFGPLLLTPTIAVSNIGIDSNVFYEPESGDPKQDFTFTVTPRADLWLHAGRTLFSAFVKEDLVWYQTYASERAANESAAVTWRVPVGRLVATTGYGYLNTRERPGFEIDARSQRKEHSGLAALELRATAKTTIGVRLHRVKVDFDKDAVFSDTDLNFELNRTETVTAGMVALQVTPYTRVSVDISREIDRFEFSPLRDSDSTRASTTVTLNPFALVKGHATVGYRDFEPQSTGIPAFKGMTAAVDLAYVAFGTTRLSLETTRDIEYSYEAEQPYYVIVGVKISLAQRLFGRVDAIGRIGWASLEYRDMAGAFVTGSNRVDHIDTYGGGIGYHLGTGTRIGLDVDHQKRTSPFEERRYQGLRVGMSVTYGL